MNFKLDTTYGYNNDMHKCKIIKYKPNNLATMNTVNTNINIILNREENHLNLRDSYLVIEFVVSDDAGGVFDSNANIRLVIYVMTALFSSLKLETSGGRIIENIDHCHSNLLMYKLLTSTYDEYESGFVRNQGNRDNQLKSGQIAAERGLIPRIEWILIIVLIILMRLLKRLLALKKDYNGLPHNIKPYINHRTFKSIYRIYVFDTRYQSDHIGPQPIQLSFKFSAAVADVISHALVLTRKVISVNSDGNKMVDIVS